MPARIARLLVLPLAAVVMTTGAANADFEPQITIDEEIAVDGGTATVTGDAFFPAITSPQSVIGDNALYTQGALGSAAGGDFGLNMTDAGIMPIPNGSGLRFVISVTDLPDEFVPELARFNWAFKIGNNLYQLQAKASNLLNVTTTEDPVGHAQHAASGQDWFQLRGACQASYQGTPANGCYHLAFLQGSFNSAADTVTIDMPFRTRDSIGRLVAEDFEPGATLIDNGGQNTAGMAIAASFQAVVSNTATSNYYNGYDPYYVGPRIHLAVGSFGQNPVTLNFSAEASIDGGRFSGEVAGLGGTSNTLFVRACNGTECTYASKFVG